MTLTRRRTAALPLAAALLLATVLPAAHADYQPPTWHFNQARIYGAEAAGHYGSGVMIAVIDTWVDGSHPSFGGRVLAGADCVGGCHPGAAPKDACADHGTHVSGTIISSDYGVAPQARVLPLRVLSYKDGECTATSTDVASAIEYAIGQHVRIINLSLAGQTALPSSSSDITSAVSDAADAGIVVVFAAGNDSAPVADSYGSDALIVAATNNKGQLASYSQRGTGVDVAAPGGEPVGGTCAYETCVVSPVPGGEYGAMAGTSMAAPHVSGLAALLIGQNPSRSRLDVMNRIRATAHPLAQAGSGLIDATAALGAAAPKPTKSPTAPTPRSTRPAVKPASKPVVVAKPSTPVTAPTPVTSPVAPTPDAATPEPTASQVEEPPSTAAVLINGDDAQNTVPKVAAAGILIAVLLGHVVVRRRSVF